MQECSSIQEKLSWLLQYSSLAPLERECYEGEVQPYRKTDYKPMMMGTFSQHGEVVRLDGDDMPQMFNLWLRVALLKLIFIDYVIKL